MFILLEGELEARANDKALYMARAGEITGKLPHSRMVTYPRTVRAATAVWQLTIPESSFTEMFQRIPSLELKLIRVMADRIRNSTADEVQQSKLAALGKLSAGLAHELNNPASAAARAAADIRQNLKRLRELDASIAAAQLTPEQRLALVTSETEALTHAQSCTALDALTRSDREEAVGIKLQKLGVPDAWDLAPELVDAGLTTASLDEFAKCSNGVFRESLSRVGVLILLDRLSEEIQESMGRISSLVKSIKDYSYMDTTPERDVDLHKDLENTLRILENKIRKSGVRVERDYDKQLPLICANGSELNQVWTNLIDNAIDAMAEDKSGREKLLKVHTGSKLERVVVEIFDTGPGVPEQLRTRIFEPFFTTKKQGEGTGLGLDVVQKIVHRHHGDIRLESAPGRTCFQVMLPIKRA